MRNRLRLFLFSASVGILVNLAAPRVGLAIAAPEVREPTSSTGAGASTLQQTSQSFRRVAEMVNPTVVNIKSTVGVEKRHAPFSKRWRGQPQPQDGFPEGQDPFRDFFGQFFHRYGQGGPVMPQAQPQTALGSGMIIDGRGYVLTNNHVVKEATEILVTVPGFATDLKAKVVGTDPQTDLAVIKVEAPKPLPSINWADSDKVEVGDWAIAIGIPFGLEHTMTLGIVSAKGRNQVGITGSEYGGGLIQTDAAINPGNSGGPLCTVDGTVMGVNTAIFTRTGGYMGIGFAIPSNLARTVASDLIAHGKVTRAWLGVYIGPLADDLGKELGINHGAVIERVEPKSPADKSGLQPGEVITQINGKEVTDVTQLPQEVGSLKPGERITLKLVSYETKRSREVKVKLEAMPARAPQSTPEDDDNGQG